MIKIHFTAMLIAGLFCIDASAATSQNAYVSVNSSTDGVEDIVSVGTDFYVTTRNVSASSFQADIGVNAKPPYCLIKPTNGQMQLGIGEKSEYRAEDESGLEDMVSGMVHVLKLDIDPVETNLSWNSTSCTLKLTDDSFPGGTAVWTSVPDGIDGSGNSITFNPNILTPGEYKVTAKSGIVSSYTDSCIVRIFSLTSETVSPIPSNRNRTILGVGEEVILTVVPAVEGMIWASDGATLISPFLGNKVSATAPAEAATFTVTCTVGNLSLSKSFTTIEPAGVEDATIEKIYSMPIGVAGAGMKFYPIHIGPRTVSFYNVRCVEVGRDAVNATGYWVTNQPPSHIGNGADEWFSLDFENRWPQEWDKAMIIGIPSPWFEGGDFEWPIPAKWTVAGSGKEKEMMGWTQKFELSGDGSVTVRKFGKWVRRTIYDYCTWGED